MTIAYSDTILKAELEPRMPLWIWQDGPKIIQIVCNALILYARFVCITWRHFEISS